MSYDQDEMEVKGDSFNSVLDWANAYKVVEMKDFILVYQNKQTANFISKKDFDESQLAEFRRLVKNRPELKVKLRG